MKRTNITDRITYLEPKSMRNFQACAGLIVNGEKKMFIDVSMGGDTAKLLKNEQPDVAVVTHYHIDHSLWLRQAERFARIKLYAPEAEVIYLTDMEHFIANTAGAYGLGDLWRDLAVNQVGFNAVGKVTPYSADDSLFADNKVCIEAINTPGHSPGHTSFYFPEERILFCGDMGVDRFGPWYGWVDCDLKKYVESVLRLQSLDTDLLLTSHGGIVEEGVDELWKDCLVKVVERERMIEQALSHGMTKAQIVEQGIFYLNKSRVTETMRTLIGVMDEAIFDHHKKVLDHGGLKAFFPEVR